MADALNRRSRDPYSFAISDVAIDYFYFIIVIYKPFFAYFFFVNFWMLVNLRYSLKSLKNDRYQVNMLALIIEKLVHCLRKHLYIFLFMTVDKLNVDHNLNSK